MSIQKRDRIEVDLDKLIELYCYVNNSIQAMPRRSLFDFLFGGRTRDEDIENYFAHLKGRIVDIIDSGLKEKSELIRTISPFRIREADIKKYLKW